MIKSYGNQLLFKTPSSEVNNKPIMFYLPTIPIEYAPSAAANSMILFVFLLSVVGFLYEFQFRRTKYYRLGNHFRGPLSLPLVGNAYMVLGLSMTDVVDNVLKLYYSFKTDVARVWLGHNLYVGIANAEDAEVILGSNVYLEKSDDYKLFEPWLGDGLLISKGDKWRSHRKMIAPTFHTTILKSFVPVFNKNANNLVKRFEEEVGNTFDVHDYMSRATVDTLLETAMGVTKTKEDCTGFEYAKAVMGMCSILHLRHVKLWLRPDFLFGLTDMSKQQGILLYIVHTLTRQVIKRKKANYFDRLARGEQSIYRQINTEEYNENNGIIGEGNIMSNCIKDDLDENDENDVGEKKRLAFLDFMIEANQISGNILTDEDIKEEVDTIMFEGHDTTAAASSFVLCLLGIYKDIQEKVFDELTEIFQDDFNRPIKFADTVEMKLLERVILESLRLYPPVPLIARKANEDIKLATGDYTIPEGATVIVGQFLIHRNIKYWPDPFKFDPDRFLPENSQNRPYYAFIPFSAGPRSCVGRKYAMLKMKILLASVLRKFKIHSSATEKDFKLQGDIILKRADGFKVQIQRRD